MSGKRTNRGAACAPATLRPNFTTTAQFVSALKNCRGFGDVVHLSSLLSGRRRPTVVTAYVLPIAEVIRAIDSTSVEVIIARKGLEALHRTLERRHLWRLLSSPPRGPNPPKREDDSRFSRRIK